MEHAAGSLAAQVRRTHGLSSPATTAELLEVCRQRGVTVVRSVRLEKAGLYLPEDRLILLAWEAPARVLAHELYHALVHDHAETHMIYTYSHPRPDAEEREAERFAGLLCGSSPHAPG